MSEPVLPETPSRRASVSTTLTGSTVAPGLALGVVHRKDDELDGTGAERVPKDEVDEELARFRHALDRSRAQLVDLRGRLSGRVDEGDARILDTHLVYLKDSAFIADVENLVVGEQLRLEAAIAKVVADFDRIFRLVENETLRQSAVDLRDVGIRVLRNLEGPVEEAQHEPPAEYILVARELSIVDMFDLSNEHVKGIATEEGGLTSHAAIFARSMRIPTLTAIDGLLEHVREGDFVILDATEGALRIEPDEVVRQQYAGVQQGGHVPAASLDVHGESVATADGEALHLTSCCGNLPEVEHGSELGLPDVGLYRTELLYLLDSTAPSRDALVGHYESVLSKCPGTVTFRLLNPGEDLELGPERARLGDRGPRGVRALLEEGGLVRRQLQALLLAAAGSPSPLRIAVPFVVDCGDLRRVRELLFEERLVLKKEGLATASEVELGAVVESPAALLGMRDVVLESDFLAVNLDSLLEQVVHLDRDATRAEGYLRLHPYVARALAKLVRVCEENGREALVFGVSAFSRVNLEFLVGLGLRSFAVPPSAAEEFLAEVRGMDAEAARGRAVGMARRSCPEEAISLLSDYHHGQV